MMRKIRNLTASIVLVAGLASCQNAGNQKNISVTDDSRTVETENLLKSLRAIPRQGVMFGHHDDPLYGIGWDGEEGRSDVKSVVGDYPAVMSFDIGHIELGRGESLDKVSFDKIRREIIAQYQRGGMNTISWHLDNPVTGGDSWDVSNKEVVAAVLPGGEKYDLFQQWLGLAADFLSSLETPDGVKVPVLFRPWHEHTGSWFWWGKELCTPEQYKALWRMTYDFMEDRGVDNLLYAYSPGTEPNDVSEYLERYPGDDIVDLIGFDCYQFDREVFLTQMRKSLDIITEIGKTDDMPIAITEFGYEAIPDPVWWTETVLPLLREYPLSYALVWRNARERETHYYAPYPGQVSAEDFVKFYDDPHTLFARDVKDLYK